MMEKIGCQKISTEFAAAFLERNGLKISTTEAKQLLDFLSILAKLYVEQNPIGDDQIAAL